MGFNTTSNCAEGEQSSLPVRGGDAAPAWVGKVPQNGCPLLAWVEAMFISTSQAGQLARGVHCAVPRGGCAGLTCTVTSVGRDMQRAGSGNANGRGNWQLLSMTGGKIKLNWRKPQPQLPLLLPPCLGKAGCCIPSVLTDQPRHCLIPWGQGSATTPGRWPGRCPGEVRGVTLFLL